MTPEEQVIVDAVSAKLAGDHFLPLPSCKVHAGEELVVSVPVLDPPARTLTRKFSFLRSCVVTGFFVNPEATEIVGLAYA